MLCLVAQQDSAIAAAVDQACAGGSYDTAADCWGSW